MEEFQVAKLLSLFFLSSVKFLFAPGAAIAAGLNEFEAIVVTSAGGMTGITFFYYFGHWALKKIEELTRRVKKGTPKPKKVFTRRNRQIIKFKISFGMAGLIIVTPAILSIPIGCVIAAKFYYQNRLTFPLLLASTCIWSIFLTYFSSTIKVMLFGI